MTTKNLFGNNSNNSFAASIVQTSSYSNETEQQIEQLLGELYDLLEIQRPVDLFGSVVIETKYQHGKPVGQVDVNIRYVKKRQVKQR